MLDERAAGAEECRAVEAVVDFDAEAGAVAVEVDDLLTQVADAEDEVSEAGGFEQAKLVGEKRFAGDFDEELGDFSVMGRRRVAMPPARRATGRGEASAAGKAVGGEEEFVTEGGRGAQRTQRRRSNGLETLSWGGRDAQMDCRGGTPASGGLTGS